LVTRNRQLICLSPTCFKIFETLMDRPGYVYLRERLLGRALGGEIAVEPRTVGVHIRRLRETLGSHGGLDLMRRVRSVGYALNAAKDA
jgi:two-component system phosphate regulon response regulator PhoB